MLVTTR